MQDEIEQKTVAFAVKTTKFTGKTLLKLAQIFLASDNMRDKLAAMGILKKEIALICKCKNDEQKANFSNKCVREKSVGSTDKKEVEQITRQNLLLFITLIVRGKLQVSNKEMVILLTRKRQSRSRNLQICHNWYI